MRAARSVSLCSTGGVENATLTRAGARRFNEWYPSAAKSIKIVCFLTTAYLKSPYCMKEFGIAQAMDKLLVVACEPVREIAAVDPSKFPHASNALAYLLGGGQVIFHDTDDVVAETMKFIPRQAAAAPEPDSPAAGGGLGLPPNAASPLPVSASAAAAPLGPDNSLPALLASARLDKYAATFSAEGYLFVSDLMAADSEEIDEVITSVGLKKPEARRFRAALASASGGGAEAAGAGGGVAVLVGGQEARLQAEKVAAEEAVAQEKARAATLQAQVDAAQQQVAQADAQRQAAEAQKREAEAARKAEEAMARLKAEVRTQSC